MGNDGDGDMGFPTVEEGEEGFSSLWRDVHNYNGHHVSSLGHRLFRELQYCYYYHVYGNFAFLSFIHDLSSRDLLSCVSDFELFKQDKTEFRMELEVGTVGCWKRVEHSPDILYSFMEKRLNG
jgi:hypothetical protein